MDVRFRYAGLVARTDRPDAVALDDRRALGHGDGAQMGERHGPPVGGLDRHALAVRRDRAGERDHAGRGRPHDRPELARHVDTAMLTRRFRHLRVEGERLENEAVDRPRPGPCRGDDGKRNHEHEQDSPHELPPRSGRWRPRGEVAYWENVCSSTVRTVAAVVKPDYRFVTETLQRAAVEVVSRHVREPRHHLRGHAPGRTGRDQVGHRLERRRLARRTAPPARAPA